MPGGSLPGICDADWTDRDDDLSGATVTMANRIRSTAGPEQVYVSDVVRDLVIESGFSFDAGRTETLKGFSGPATIYELLDPS